MKQFFSVVFLLLSFFSSNAQSYAYPHANLGRDLHDQGKYAESALELEIAANIIKDTEARPLFFYEAACSWSMAKDTAKALRALQRSIDAGWKDIEWIKQDRELSLLLTTSGCDLLLSRAKLRANQETSVYYWGFYLGLLFVLFCYNMILFISLRDISFLWYSLYIFFSACMESARTINFGYYANELMVWLRFTRTNHPVMFYLSLSVLFFLLFSRSFLTVDQTFPKLKNWMKGFVILFILSATQYAIPFEFGARDLTYFFILLAFLFVFGIAFLSWRKGFKPARLFLLAGAVLFAGVYIAIFNSYRWLHFELRLFEFGPVQIGLMVFFLLMSFALGDRIKVLQKEKEEAQEKALEVLEEKVKERTAEVVKQKELIEEKQKEILDSIRYAKRIQRSLLPTEKYLERILKR